VDSPEVSSTKPDAVAAGGLIPLHPRMRLMWSLSHGFWFGVLLLVPALPLAVLRGGLPLRFVLPLAFVVGALLGWRYALRYAALYSAQQLADGVLIRRGVWWRSEVFVPRARIQHTEINQGPLDRRWGMASVSIHTAGTRLEQIALPGVPRDVAQALRDVLLDRQAHADGA
jgi:membrane protein YdbS with pleckstrin-like domain